MLKFFKMIMILTFIIGIFWLGKSFIKTDYFNIENVSIKGDVDTLEEDIKKQLELLKGKNIIYLDSSKIEKLLNEDVRIKNVKVKKKYPSELNIEVEMRKPYFYLKKGNDLYLADETLNLFGYAFERENQNIPIVIYENDEVQKELKEVVTNMKSEDLYGIVSEIKKTSEIGENSKKYELILLNGDKIITNTSVISERYDEAYKLYEKVKNSIPIKYMDIRFENINIAKE